MVPAPRAISLVTPPGGTVIECVGLNTCWAQKAGYTACRWETTSESNGTLTWMVVPPLGLESMSMLPLTKRARSRMLVSPRPAPWIADRSNPWPESFTVRWTSFECSQSLTSILLVPLCSTALCRACWRIRNKESATSWGRLRGTPCSLNSMFTLFLSETSLTKLLAAATRPKYSNLDECNWWDRLWTSRAISEMRCLACLT